MYAIGADRRREEDDIGRRAGGSFSTPTEVADPARNFFTFCLISVDFHANVDKVYEHMFSLVEDLLKGVERRVASLEPALVMPSAADRLVGLFAWGAKLCMAAVCVLAARAAEQIQPRNGGVLPAEHLARQLGCTLGDARRILEASAHLDDAPGTRAELLAGKISALQAADIIAARREAEAAREREEAQRRNGAGSEEPVTEDPGPAQPWREEPASPADVEQRLLDEAEGSSATDTRRAADKERAAARDEETQRRYAHRNRCWRKRTYGDGLAGGEYRLPPEVAADVNARIEEMVEKLFEEARRSGVREPRDAYGADALSLLLAGVRSADPDAPAPVVPTGGEEPAPPAESSPASRPGPSECPRLPKDLVVRVDLAALLRGRLEGGEVCEIPGAGPYPLAAVRAALGHDALVNLILTEGKDVRSIVCGGRQANKALRLAILEQYQFCVDCGSRFRLQFDHHQPYSLDGPTSFDNQRPRCQRCHAAKSRREAKLTQAAGRRKAAERSATCARAPSAQAPP